MCFKSVVWLKRFSRWMCCSIIFINGKFHRNNKTELSRARTTLWLFVCCFFFRCLFIYLFFRFYLRGFFPLFLSFFVILVVRQYGVGGRWRRRRPTVIVIIIENKMCVCVWFEQMQVVCTLDERRTSWWIQCKFAIFFCIRRFYW